MIAGRGAGGGGEHISYGRLTQTGSKMHIF